MGACGCGTSSGSPFSWQTGIAPGVYTAAASQAIFGSGTWCGSGCGQCFKLTSTGSAPCSGCGTGGAAGQSIIVMVTNLCPYNGNQQWCPNAGLVILSYLCTTRSLNGDEQIHECLWLPIPFRYSSPKPGFRR